MVLSRLTSLLSSRPTNSATKNPSLGLQKLPNELLIKILQLLPGRHLKALRFASRKLNDVAMLVLFTNKLRLSFIFQVRCSLCRGRGWYTLSDRSSQGCKGASSPALRKKYLSDASLLTDRLASEMDHPAKTLTQLGCPLNEDFLRSILARTRVITFHLQPVALHETENYFPRLPQDFSPLQTLLPRILQTGRAGELKSVELFARSDKATFNDVPALLHEVCILTSMKSLDLHVDLKLFGDIKSRSVIEHMYCLRDISSLHVEMGSSYKPFQDSGVEDVLYELEHIWKKSPKLQGYNITNTEQYVEYSAGSRGYSVRIPRAEDQ